MSPSHVSTPSLAEFPVEILTNICQRLDPVGLVSLSQSSMMFRNLTNIQKRHLVERLLALELTPEYGGGAPTLRVRDQILTPPFSEEAWANSRWTCSGCLRLLPHIHFDNHSILRLRNRKPVPGSPAAQPVTSWEPSPRGKTCHTGRKPTPDEERRNRLRYRLAIHPYEINEPPYIHRWTVQELRDVGMQGFDNIDDDEYRQMGYRRKRAIFDRNLEEMELVLAGTNRHNRKCNECRYKSGQLRVQLGHKHGTSAAPVMNSRQLHFASTHDRFFPGLPEHMGMPEPSLHLPIGEICRINDVFVMDPVAVYSRAYTMYMVRCPCCESWQEVRAFRLGGYEHWWNPRCDAAMWDNDEVTIQDAEIICNHCFARKYGKLALGEQLADFVGWIVNDNARRYLEAQLCWGWFALGQVVTRLPKEYRRQVRLILRNVAGLKMRTWEGVDFSHIDIATLRLRHGEFVNVCKKGLAIANNEAVRFLFTSFWFHTWLYAYDKLEEEWLWMDAYARELREKPETLAEWALSRNPACLN
ncbi:unnamed protein product [Clonostachys rosea]|uniref:F-box domain-containing protein n=1 Tax=Bionectria ochroleuca TaxID=29856 RepID=A0ABY6UNQ8_BIOOC|nr:unnamed protein product [Clonostachys rosea]